MNVLQIVDSLELGGTERMAVSLAFALAQAGIGSHLCVTRRSGPLADTLPPQIPVLYLNRRWRFDLAAILRLRRYIRENNISHIHAHSTSLAVGWLATVGRKDCALLWHIHSGVVPRGFSWAGVAFRLLGRKLGHVCCASHKVAEHLRELFPERADSVTVLSNMVPAERDERRIETPLPGVRGKRIVCVANLRCEKGHPTLLQAFAEFSHRYPDWVMLLVGRENEKGLLQRLGQFAQELAVADRVHFLGARHDVPAILRECDIGVLASVSEAFPVVLLEYGLAGLPVVATAVGDVPHILRSGEAGLLVSPGGAMELAEGLTRLADDATLRHRLGEALRRHVENNFSTEKVAGELVHIYKSMVHSG